MKPPLRLLAPAKVNLTFEVLGRRPDGYHEIRSVLLTLDLADIVVLEEAPALALALAGEAGPLVEESVEDNLAWRAAQALQREVGVWKGAEVRVEKRVPVAAGLGGGASDAAAVLRGLNVLWDLDLPLERLEEVAAGVGSDVPFFLHGGAALVSGRGERVARLPDLPPLRLLLATPRRPSPPGKTASMYARLQPEQFGDGAAGERLAERIAGGLPVHDDDIVNAFTPLLATAAPETEAAMAAMRALGRVPHLAGAGPGFFLLTDPAADVSLLFGAALSLGRTPRLAGSLPRGRALSIETLD